MSPGQEAQLEKLIDEVLKSGGVEALDAFLQTDIHNASPIKCSQHFLTKVDKLVNWSLDEKYFKSASLGLAVIHKHGKNLKLPDCHGLQGIIAKGLHKMWFEKCSRLWIQHGPQWDEALFNLSEDFFDALIVTHDSCEEGTYQITELFLYPVGQLAVDSRIYILIKKEAIRKFNLILDKIPVALKKKRKFLSSQEASDIMVKIAAQILDGGDFDFQTALVEALCRMATSNQRKDLADHWFKMGHVASAFVKIRDSEFETDCRKFLNLVNGMQGDRRRVYSYPCLEAYMDKYELLIPADEKLEEFWIDFNLGSRSISFYFSLADEESQWETICITENEVKSYTITEKDKRFILQIHLSEAVVVGAVEGSTLAVHFSSSLDIPHAARSVYGHNKNKGFLGKTSTSVVKTTVQIKMEDSGSQMVTPVRRKISESSIVYSSSTGGSVNGPNSFSAVQLTKGKGKPSLEMVGSRDSVKATPKLWSYGSAAGGTIEQRETPQEKTASKQAGNKNVDKSKKNIPEAKGVDFVPVRQKEEQSTELTCVPDTQLTSGRNSCASWSKLSVSEMLMMSTQKVDSVPKSESRLSLSRQQGGHSAKQTSSVPVLGPVGSKQLHSEVIQRLKKLVSKRNQSPAPQEPVEPQKNTYSGSASCKDRSSTDHCDPPAQEAQTAGLTRGKSKGQTSAKLDASPLKAPAKAATTRALPGSVKAETKKALSNKEKRDAELAGDMVKSISSRYESKPKDVVENLPKRPNFNMTWLSTTKRAVTVSNVPKSLLSKPVTNSTKQKEDIFTFNPVSLSNTEEKAKKFRDNSATLSSDIYNSSAALTSTKKQQPVAKSSKMNPSQPEERLATTNDVAVNWTHLDFQEEDSKKGQIIPDLTKKQHVKKHLFSDTDTDYATTEVSWLRESNRKSKPKITKYSRPVPLKPKVLSAHGSSESSDLALSSEKLSKCNIPPKKTKPVGKARVRQPKKMEELAAAPTQPRPASRRPQRAAAVRTKGYKEQDSDDSQSDESSVAQSSSSNYVENADKTHKAAQAAKKRTGTKSLPKSCTKKEDNNQSRNSKVQPLCSKERKELTDVQAPCQTPVIEVMRSAERSDPTCSPSFTLRGSPLPASINPSCQDTPSPIPLLPKPCRPASSKGNTKPLCYNSREKPIKTQFIRSPPPPTPTGHSLPGPNAAEVSPVHHLQASPLLSPLLTSTQLELRKLSISSPSDSPFPEDAVSHGSHYGFNKVSSVSQISLSLSPTQPSVRNSRFNDSPSAAVGITTEKSPSSKQDPNLGQFLISGPTRKRHLSSDSSEEDEKEEVKKSKMRGQHSSRIKPRRLFESCAKVPPNSEISQWMSSSHTKSSWHSEAEEGREDVDTDGDLELSKVKADPGGDLCQKFGFELRDKFKTHYKMTAIYSKQSLKTIQHHTSSLNVQLATDRTQRQQQLQEFLLEEISKLEQNDTMIKTMEKELAVFRKKQTMTFCSFKDQEVRRNENMKKAFQNNVCQSLEHEKRVFTSQMCLIKEDMKSVQDRLLSQMQKEELQSVKRSLHALFFP